jgi:hypothetical protein
MSGFNLRSASIRAVLALALLVIPTGTLSGQAYCSPQSPCTLLPDDKNGTPRWQGHALALGANAALGALSAGVVRAARGESFWDGFYRGGAGGGIAYLGRYIAVQDLLGAGLIGRQTTALGASITGNAITGSGTFERLTFPLGPVRIHRSPSGARVTLDLLTIAGTIHGLTRSGSKFDLHRSLESGTITFRADSIPGGLDGYTRMGKAIGGTVFYRRSYSYRLRHEIIAHETVHVLQHDFAGIALGSPFESWLADRMPAPIAKPLRYLDLGSYSVLRLIPLAFGVTGPDTPWEREAYFLVRNSPAPTPVFRLLSP